MAASNKITLSNYKKRKTTIALFLKITTILGVTIFYLIASYLTETNNEGHSNKLQFSDKNTFNKRKILSILINENSINEISTKNENILVNKTIKNCTSAAILDFPSDGLTRNNRKSGWIIIHVLLACYCFWFLAVCCDEYFVPSIELMCKKLNMKEDVAGATFMAAATSSPELFINCVGTFITEGDIGIGTIVGSAVFNILAVPACCGLICRKIVYLDWWSVSRDSLMYNFSVILLICTLYDGIVMWYEAFILVLAYIFYIIIMYFNDKISVKVKLLIHKLKHQTRQQYKEVTEISPLLLKDKIPCGSSNGIDDDSESIITIADDETTLFTELATNPWCQNNEKKNFIFFLRWPITFLLYITMPDCRKTPKMHLLTFTVCIIWIGFTSYLVAFLITVMGDTMNIPDSVMGLTLLAAGTSVPEAVSSVIVTNQGHGSMGISNSIGSNTFDILLCLGLPWLIKSIFAPSTPGNYWVILNSTGLKYSAISLLSTLYGLYFAFVINKFRLDWKIGVICTLMYITFLIFSSLVELNIFFPVNIPTCLHYDN